MAEKLSKSEEKIVKEVMGKCGHINRHSKDVHGKLDNLSCEKDKGHAGNHGGNHIEWQQDTEGTMLISKKLHAPKPVWVEWGDMAGIPVEKIKPIPSPKPVANMVSDMSDVRDLVGGEIPEGTVIE